MTAAFIAVGLFVVLMTAITWVGYRHYARPGRYFDQLGAAILDRASGEHSALEERPGGLARTLADIGRMMPISLPDAALQRRFLVAAGFRSDAALYVLYGIKVVACIALAIVAFALKGYLTEQPLFRILIVIAGALAGYFGPGIVLDRLVSKRQNAMKLSLPEALDLMVVCVEAGLGLDQSILNVSRELAVSDKDLADEFGLVTLEMQAGKRRADALSNLAQRTGVDEIRKLVAVLIQTDRFGTSMADSLRTHSEYMRIRRRQEAEERAAKVGVKLVFPIFFFILPAMFVVVAAPALLQIFKQLLPALRTVQ